MRIRLLVTVAVTLALAACADSSTAPRMKPAAPSADITCKSGYHPATREDGTQFCEPDEGGERSAGRP